MIRWLRVVLPPWWAVAIAAGFCLPLPMLLVVLEWRIGEQIFRPDDRDSLIIVLSAPCMATFLYAIYRVWAFHPALRQDYLRWLRSTPWTRDKPMLLGPIHLVWQDVLIVALLVAVCIPRVTWYALIVAQVFVFVYVLALGCVLAVTDAKWWAFGVGIGVGLMALFAPDKWIFFGVAGITYVVAYLGLRASLAHFPWENSPLTQPLDSAPKPLGWPYDQLGPLPAERYPIQMLDVSLSVLIAGWWFFVINEHFWRDSGERHGALIAFLVLAGFGIVGRVGRYCGANWEPISMHGRLGNGYLVIPGYDRVFIAPLIALLIGLATIVAHLNSPIDPCIVPSIGFALAWITLLGMGPSLREWRLTGHHRVIPTAPPAMRNR